MILLINKQIHKIRRYWISGNATQDNQHHLLRLPNHLNFDLCHSQSPPRPLQGPLNARLAIFPALRGDQINYPAHSSLDPPHLQRGRREIRLGKRIVLRLGLADLPEI